METPAWPEALSKFGLYDPLDPERAAPRLRKSLRDAATHLDAKPPAIDRVSEFTIPGPGGSLPVRLYVPKGSTAPAPCMLGLHGGGYVIGDLDTHDRMWRRLAALSGVRILALDYRLAPEHRFPAAVDDALAAFDWLAGEAGSEAVGADPTRLAVGGDSAGGGLAAVVSQERRAQLRFQLLIYPLMQLVERKKPKLKALEGHLFSAFTLNQIARAYLSSDEEARDVRVSPLFETDLAGLPPAHIFAAELDPLLDEGRAYRDRLQATGLKAGYTLGKALPHGYFNLTAILPGAKTLVNDAARVLGEALRP